MSIKFDLFVKYYSDPNEKGTFGNGTKSAIKAYGLDPETQYSSARVIASENLTKLNYLARDYLDSKGISFFKLIDVAVAKMIKSDSPGWFDRVMILCGYKNEQEKTIIQQFNNSSMEIGNDEKNQLNEDFNNFLVLKYGTKENLLNGLEVA